jgi:putative tricarboxylic transport membrane protein
MVESNYRRALVLSSGDHVTFLREPLSAALLGIAAIFIVGTVIRHLTQGRRPEAANA